MMLTAQTSRVSFEEIEAHLEEFVDRTEAGECFEIVRNGKVVARLMPPEADTL